MTELHDLTALEQGTAVRKKEVSTAELVEHYLDTVGVRGSNPLPRTILSPEQ